VANGRIGLATIGAGVTKSYSGLLVCRFLGGVFEAGLIPCRFVQANRRKEADSASLHILDEPVLQEI
jgi:hypothetical protein